MPPTTTIELATGVQGRDLGRVADDVEAAINCFGERQPDGTWIPHTADAEGEPLLDMQDYLINASSRRRAFAK